MPAGKKSLVAALVALAVVVAAGLAGYNAHQKRQQERAIVAALSDTTLQLRQALAATPAAGAFSAIEGNLETVNRAQRQPALADAAKHYIISARELVRRRVEIARLEREAAASRQALSAHMARAASRNNAWFRDAMDLKKKVEREHFDLNLMLRAVDELLYTLPDSYKALAPHADSGLLLEESLLENARHQTRADVVRVAVELDRARSLPGR